MTAYIRTGMKELISHKMTRGQNNLPVLLLEPALEEALVEQSLDAEAIDRLLAAVREEMGGYSPGAADRPAILTDVGVRAHGSWLLAPSSRRTRVGLPGAVAGNEPAETLGSAQ